MAEMDKVLNCKIVANQIRRDIIEMAYSVGNTGAHLGGSLSMVEILAVLYKYKIKFDKTNPNWEQRDRVILSKGHAALALYPALVQAGIIEREKLSEFKKNGALLSGHPSLNGLSGIELDRVVGKEGGEEGSGLSGGQEKKMLLIRSLLMNDRYMILDEPTSASDSETEDLVFSSLKQRNGYLLVSHRISKLKNVSRIIVLKEGRIVSDGNWLEMTKNESLLKELLECERRLYTRDSI